MAWSTCELPVGDGVVIGEAWKSCGEDDRKVERIGLGVKSLEVV